MVDRSPEDPGFGDVPERAPEIPASGERGEVRRLYRSSDQRILIGVCGGLGEYFDIDPTLVRIVFVVLTFAGFSGLLLYVVLAFIMPAEDKLEVHPRDAARATLDEAVDGSKLAATRASDWVRSKTGRRQDARGQEPPHT